jgi:hypothetical protein
MADSAASEVTAAGEPREASSLIAEVLPRLMLRSCFVPSHVLLDNVRDSQID